MKKVIEGRKIGNRKNSLVFLLFCVRRFIFKHFILTMVEIKRGANMMEQEFIIKGTIDGMIKILKQDFGMSDEEAKFLVYVLVNQHSGEAINAVSKEDLDVWYLSKEDKHEGLIPNTHLAINFTNIKLNLYRQVYLFFAKYFFAREIDLVLIGIDLVYIVASAIQKIKDTDYCVYARIIEICMGNKDRFFDMSDIVTANKDGKCDYQDDKWKCAYLGQTENCTCDREKVELAFESLTENNLIKKVGERWILMK